MSLPLLAAQHTACVESAERKQVGMVMMQLPILRLR